MSGQQLKKIIKRLSILFSVLDFFLMPLTLIAIAWFRLLKFIGLSKTPASSWLFRKVGIHPIVDHYYEPLFQFDSLSPQYGAPRILSGIDWNDKFQLSLIDKFNYHDELAKFTLEKNSTDAQFTFYHNNGSFGYTDAEYLYSFVRLTKPKRIIEIGGGFSTLMMLEALKVNQTDFELSCVEPYEMPWLKTLPVLLFREKVEKIPVSIFQELQAGDILFIDSSHIIRPEGDVLYELFEILPRLKPGVYIHIHDIFTPHHYPERWLREEFRLWNEQYLVEAFLINNSGFEIVGALNYLSTKYNDLLFSKLPIASHAEKPNGSSLWLRKMIK